MLDVLSLHAYGMRILSFILSLLILVLTCLPCDDADAAHVAVYNSTKGHIQTESPCQTEHGKRDVCSPFCHCGCWAVLYSPCEKISVPLYVIYIKAPTYPGHPEQVPVNISLPVWQPPQLA